MWIISFLNSMGIGMISQTSLWPVITAIFSLKTPCGLQYNLNVKNICGIHVC